jgi:hypothetical protein
MSITKKQLEIIAVGYTVTFSSELVEFIAKKFPDVKLPTDMKMAIWFNKNRLSAGAFKDRARIRAGGPAPIKGITEENCRPANEIESWYNKRVYQLTQNDESFYRIRLNKLYASGTLIVGVFDCMGTNDVAYGFLYNENDQPTSVIKKAITSGKHEAHNLKRIAIPEEFVSEGVPYIYSVSSPPKTVLRPIQEE